MIQTPQHGLLFREDDYLTQVDMTGRIVCEDKRGAIPGHTPPILDKLQLDIDTWCENATSFEAPYPQRFKPRRKTKVA